MNDKPIPTRMTIAPRGQSWYSQELRDVLEGDLMRPSISDDLTDEQIRQAVQIETLNLLQKTVDYLNRLPVVPMTRALCKEIEAHLADPSIEAAKRAAMQAERMATTRVAQRYSPAGKLMAEVIVTADNVTYKFPEIQEMRSLENLRTGETLKF
jgi:hypothetical protein